MAFFAGYKPSAAQQALQGPVTKKSGGAAKVPSGMSEAQPGWYPAGTQDFWSRAAGGMETTETWTPQKNLRGQVVGTNYTREMANPLSVGDIAAQAMRDVGAQREAKQETRQIAEQALQGVKTGYGTAIDNLTREAESMRATSEERVTESRDLVRSRFEQAAAMTEDVLGQAGEFAATQTGRALTWRDQAEAGFQDAYASKLDVMRRAAERDYNTRLGNIDNLMGQGQITGVGGMSAEQTGQQMKQQLQSEYRDQLRATMSQLGVESANASNDFRTKVDQYTLSITQAAGAAGVTAGVGLAGVMQNLAAAEAQAEGVFLAEQRQYEHGVESLLLAAEQMRIREPELSAELMLSSAYLPDAEQLAPLAAEIFEMYSEVEARNAADLRNVMATSTPQIQTPLQPWGIPTTARQAAANTTNPGAMDVAGLG